MRRETQNVLLVLLGGALLKIGINGDYLRYVKPSQQIWIIAGGAVVVVLGAVAIVRDLLARGRETDGHHHAARPAWLLLLPVLAVFLVAPPALGSDSVTRTEARAPAQDQSVFPPLPPGDVIPLPLTDFVTRAGWDPGGSLNDRTVRLTGFVTHTGDSVLLARMVITCCAADAYPLKVRMRGLPAGYENDTWLEVTGRVVPGTATKATTFTPDFVVASARRITAPADPYED
ncbi:TIGR03943 family putative permease subunit [Amycolatopsis pithecellobii]|uniref:TIGR03943 family protein n=1 Tax=Amycolatopsis pithecellobii TaxID=664692 RepID=A0A6N7Z0M0_9PSEU|nr:TIGR03943 family protein [Amycolatopsis pithecellobii]MTD54863.1 TIGR03943 family protein [Amycolatopsis pithecellobii]